MKKLPFPNFALVTDIQVFQSIESEDGFTEKRIFIGKCNYSERSRAIMNERNQVVETFGRVLLKGDIYPGKRIQGYVLIGRSTEKLNIERVRRPRNPDGTVFSTELELS